MSEPGPTSDAAAGDGPAGDGSAVESSPASTRDAPTGEAGVVADLLDATGGAAVVVAGTLVGMGLNLAGRSLFARTFSQANYGLFSLSFTVASILTVVGTLGLWTGVTRQIAFHGASGRGGGADGDDHDTDPGTVIAWGFFASFCAAVAVGLALWAGAEPLAAAFGKPAYSTSFRAAAVAVPSLALVRIGTATFRGFSRTKERVVFQELLQKGTFPLALLGVTAAGLGFGPAMAAFPASLALTAVAYVAYTAYANPGSFRTGLLGRLGDVAAGTELLRFSLPLLFASLLIQIMAWTDILMLGYFTTPDVVGVYDAVRPLVRVVPVIWGSMIFVYTPLVSGYHAEDDRASMRRAYFVLTKWFASATYPIILVFLLFPELVLASVFGPGYAGGATALRVLAAAYFLGNVMGPNGATLTALGRTRLVMYANGVAAVANVGLNVALIPRYGLVGAATATAAALVARNTIRVWLLWRIARVHSLRRPMTAPVLLAGVVVATATPLVDGYVTEPWHLLPATASIVAAYAGSHALVGGMSDADRALSRVLANRARCVVALARN